MVKVFFIHTVNGLSELFTKLCREHLGQSVGITHISDESLIQRILAAGGLTPAIYRRVCGHVAAAEEAGADFIQLTCSTISPCAEAAQALVSVPVLKVDQPMAEEAVRLYKKIGVIATNPATLAPSGDLVEATARRMNRAVTVKRVLCVGAYDAFFRGDLEAHDKIILSHLDQLTEEVEVVLLAQASMARVAALLPEARRKIPVLAPPEWAVRRLAALMKKTAWRPPALRRPSRKKNK